MTDQKYKELLANLLTGRRRKLKLTQARIAELVGCSESYICKLELGYMKKQIQIDKAAKLAKALNMTLDEFVSAVSIDIGKKK